MLIEASVDRRNGSTRVRAAASSMASGRPSSRGEISTTSGAVSSVSANAGCDGPGPLDEQLDRLVAHRLDRP